MFSYIILHNPGYEGALNNGKRELVDYEGRHGGLIIDHDYYSRDRLV